MPAPSFGIMVPAEPPWGASARLCCFPCHMRTVKPILEVASLCLAVGPLSFLVLGDAGVVSDGPLESHQGRLAPVMELWGAAVGSCGMFLRTPGSPAPRCSVPGPKLAWCRGGAWLHHHRVGHGLDFLVFVAAFRIRDSLGRRREDWLSLSLPLGQLPCALWAFNSALWDQIMGPLLVEGLVFRPGSRLSL